MNCISDYWTSVIFKQVVGKNVLKVAGSTDLGRTVRVYSFCSRNITGGVVIVAINTNNATVQFTLQATFSMSPRLEYQLTAPNGDMSSAGIELNGVVLTARADGSLPDLSPALVQDNDPITMAGLSYGMFVFPEANAGACL